MQRDSYTADQSVATHTRSRTGPELSMHRIRDSHLQPGPQMGHSSGPIGRAGN
jgi:hypothetical protein